MDRRLIAASLFAFLVAVVLMAPQAFAQSNFPFNVTRDSNGKLVKIELPNSKSRQTEDALSQLRAAMGSNSIANLSDQLSSAGLKTKEEKDAFEDARRVLNLVISKKDVEDPRLDGEFAKAKVKLDGLQVYRLLASPYEPAAFDKENAVKEAVEALMEAAKLVLIATPPMRIFEFIVDQHLDALEARREFHQNRLLALIQDSKDFSVYEKSLIRSSIFYSRLWIVNPIARKDARKVWNTYGDNEWKKIQTKCAGFVSKTDRSYSQCFKVVGNEIRNRLVNYDVLSKNTSLAYDFDAPTRVRNTRIVWFMLKLGLKFVVAPGWAKKGVSHWISSHYSDQRRSEGYVYQSALGKGETDLAAWIAVGNANPILFP